MTRAGIDLVELFTYCVERIPFERALPHYHMLNEKKSKLSKEEFFDSGHRSLNHAKCTDRGGLLMVARFLRHESRRWELYDMVGVLRACSLGEPSVQGKGEMRLNRRSNREVLSELQCRRIADDYRS